MHDQQISPQELRLNTRQRHEKAPTPDGCRWCGFERVGHGNVWVRSVGGHRWATPTSVQRLARMRARQNSKV